MSDKNIVRKKTKVTYDVDNADSEEEAMKIAMAAFIEANPNVPLESIKIKVVPIND